jgi:hypothetical protein
VIAGDPQTLALKSCISQAYANRGLLALGCFTIYVGGFQYGVDEPEATLLANSFDEVGRRIVDQGEHGVDFSLAPAAEIADAVIAGIYAVTDEDESLFGLPRADFRSLLHARQIVWAPDGDAAFDDGSRILQFDIGDLVRVIGFRQASGYVHDPESLRDVTLPGKGFYDILCTWRQAFESDWRYRVGSDGSR